MLSSDFLLLENYRPFIGAVAFLLGAIVGSFINVVTHRLPKIMEKNWLSQCSELLSIPQQSNGDEGQVFNLAFPASHCPKCLHEIRWWENIPVFSYLALKGKCSNCQQPISLRYPIVEFATACLSAIVIWHFGFNVIGMSGLLLTWALISLTCIDIDTQLLPDDITLPLLWLGLLVNLFTIHTSINNAVIGAMIGYLSLWSIYWLFKLATGKEGMGYGDFKLLAALGAWLGWQALPVIILLSSVVGSVIGISMILFKGRDSQIPIPFGPYLAIAGWIALIARDQLMNIFPFIHL